MRDLARLTKGELDALQQRESRNYWGDNTDPLANEELRDARRPSEELRRINAELRRRAQH